MARQKFKRFAAALGLGLLMVVALPALAAEYRAVDGDTIALADLRYRLLDVDTPESYSPRCRAEKMIADRATARLQELLDSGDVEVKETGRLDKYKRRLAHFFSDGRDVSQVLIREGYGEPYTGRTKRRDWCAPLKPERPQRSLEPFEREDAVPD